MKISVNATSAWCEAAGLRILDSPEGNCSAMSTLLVTIAKREKRSNHGHSTKKMASMRNRLSGARQPQEVCRYCRPVFGPSVPTRTTPTKMGYAFMPHGPWMMGILLPRILRHLRLRIHRCTSRVPRRTARKRSRPSSASCASSTPAVTCSPGVAVAGCRGCGAGIGETSRVGGRGGGDSNNGECAGIAL